MPTRHAPRTRTLRRHVTAGPAVGLLAMAMVAMAPGTASATESRTSTSQYEAELVRAERHCLETVATPEDGDAMVRCVGDLAPPDRSSAVAVDLFRLFTDCLYIASQQALDQPYPPTDEDYENYFNECLGL